MTELKPGDLVKTWALRPHTMWTFDLGDRPNTHVVQSIRDLSSSKIAGDQLVVVLELVEVDGKLRNMKPHPSWLALDTRHFVKVLDVASQRLGWVQDVALNSP